MVYTLSNFFFLHFNTWKTVLVVQLIFLNFNYWKKISTFLHIPPLVHVPLFGKHCYSMSIHTSLFQVSYTLCSWYRSKFTFTLCSLLIFYYFILIILLFCTCFSISAVRVEFLIPLWSLWEWCLRISQWWLNNMIFCDVMPCSLIDM